MEHDMSSKNALDVASRTDVGRIRSRNEDRIGQDLRIGAVMLADGMGGHSGGDIASTIAVDTVLQQLQVLAPATSPSAKDLAEGHHRLRLALSRAVTKANEIIYTTAEAQPQYRGMGTTLVAAIFRGDRIVIANVGDSRLYRIRGASMEQLTVDHTMVQELIDKGLVTPAQAYASLNRNIITRALGPHPTVAIDIREDKVLPGDIYLLCSDGLTDMVEDRHIHRVITTYGADLDEAAEQLVVRANGNGGKDNTSVVLVRRKKP
jgi:PPM family protein phosphatase